MSVCIYIYIHTKSITTSQDAAADGLSMSDS